MEAIPNQVTPVIHFSPTFEGPFSKIPIELILHSLSFLNAHDLLSLRLSCHSLKKLCEDKSLDLDRIKRLKAAAVHILQTKGDSPSFWHRGYEIQFSERVYHFKTQVIHVLPKPYEMFNQYRVFFDIGPKRLILEFVDTNDPTLAHRINVLEFIKYSSRSEYISLMPPSIDKNFFVLLIDHTHIVFIDNCLRPFHVPPAGMIWGLSSVSTYSYNNNKLLVNYEVAGHGTNQNFQLLFDITERKLLSSRAPDFVKIGPTFITQNFIITTLEVERAYTRVEICDPLFCHLNTFDIRLPENVPYHPKQEFYNAEVFACYDNRLAVFFNEATLLFYELPTGKLLNYYYIGLHRPDLKADTDNPIQRVKSYRNKIVASTANSLRLYDMHTGKLIHIFPTEEQAIEFDFTQVDENYVLTYSYNRETGNFCFAYITHSLNSTYVSAVL